MSQPSDAATVGVNPEFWVKAVRSYWQGGGYRLTEPRQRMLDSMVAYAAPFSAEQLYADMQTVEVVAPGRATVYRTIEQLNGAGWLARIHTQSGEGYVPSFPGHLHHLVCTRCGKVVAFEGCALEGLVERLASQTDFMIEGHLLQLYGRCGECQRV
ncbi:transcriptional repressor [Candidatus Gracilibacteria bacterium]|nr:transcriptional repressor [Candidatus Gracilibacteria bacterium]